MNFGANALNLQVGVCAPVAKKKAGANGGVDEASDNSSKKKSVEEEKLKNIDKVRGWCEEELELYLSKISNDDLFAYNVYQIEGLGKSLFSKIEGNENTIMGLPVEKIKEYLHQHNE